MERIADRLRAARHNAGFATPEQFAERVGVTPEIYRGYEDGTRYMSPQLGYRLAQVLGVGWVDLLYGPEYTDDYADFGYQGTSFRRRHAPQQELASYAGGGTDVLERPADANAANQRALATRSRAHSDYLPELEQARALLEAPALRNAPAARAPRPTRESRGNENEVIAFDELDTKLVTGAGLQRAGQHPQGTWIVPREALKTGSRIARDNLKMLAVLTDEMEPTFHMNDRILVDTSDTKPSPAGVFVVWDGLSLVVRRIEIVAGSEPVKVRISTDNPRYQPVERLMAETLIQGRAVARWSWV
ncbi:MAG TPA: helix-turn-helix domain-containing protein [Stellaceae bacterium]|jgi:transcriptional regulator with XRE-family HTH domain|nr:helix-turn-helix domain-containing protein [Stellaceae bacterium]